MGMEMKMREVMEMGLWMEMDRKSFLALYSHPHPTISLTYVLPHRKHRHNHQG